ncbi:MAG: hypothetical protein WCT29_00950 [Candidatus Paceibacterota bacterium]|jgi:primosomal protein N' (replication factor Y)
MKILSVIPLKKGIPKGHLTYFTSLPVQVGHVVSVPIRQKKVLALVLTSDDLGEAKSGIKNMNFNLKKIAQDKGPSIFSREFLEAASETSKYFALSPNAAIPAMIPAIFIQEYDKLVGIEQESNDMPPTPNTNLRSEKLLFQYPLPDRISIYKTIIRESFARGKSIFLVLPTESDVNKFATLLSKGIERFTFAFHGGINAKKNFKNYELLATSKHPALIVATPRFLAMPQSDIGTIILEHESSSAYKTIKRPYLDLRVFVEIYASKIGAKFILADEMLRFETIARKEEDHLHPLYPLSFRVDFPGEIEVKERGQREVTGEFKIFSKECLELIKYALGNKKNVFIFALRKGLAMQTVCRDCGDTLGCPDCSSPLVLYTTSKSKKRMFVCNRCERDWGAEKTCDRCGGWNLMPLGIGTDTVFEEIKNVFPKVKIFQLDKESAKSAKGAEKIAQEFENEEGSVLIGTEMAFFYLKNKIPLSVVASFDSLWSIPNYKMSEKVIQIALKMTQITTEKLVLETKNPTDPSVLAIKSGNLLGFVREELADRQKLEYPPYARFIKISHLGDRDEMLRARKFIQESFGVYNPDIFSGFVAKLHGKYATNALIKLAAKQWSLPALSLGGSIDENLYHKLASLAPTFDVFVDPEDLL